MGKKCSFLLRSVCLLLCAACLMATGEPTGAAPKRTVQSPGGAAIGQQIPEIEVFNAQAQTAPAEKTTLTSNVRSGPSVYYPVIGQMEDGTAVTVLGERSGFYKIDCYDMNGYIAKSQVIHTDGKYYIHCDPASNETKTLTYTSHAQALALRHSLLTLAAKHLGTPYVYGGFQPGGFDCSGLMLYLYRQHGIELLRTASNQLTQGIIVPREGMQVGDLVFFREYGEDYPVSHVGIYAGNNQVIHSGSNGVEYATLEGPYFGRYFLCARRILWTQSAEIYAGADGLGALDVPSFGGRGVN